MASLSEIELDKDGFLKNLSDWNLDIAQEIAQQISITLTPSHFEIIELLRAFYHKHQVAPANRPFVKMVKMELGAEKGNSIYLLQLFPESPAKICAKIAGLPRPANCL